MKASRSASSTLAIALAAFSYLTAAPERTIAQEARASLAAELDFFDPATREPMRPEAGEPFGMRVSLTDVTTGRAPRGLTIAGWIRAIAPGNSECAEAAQAFRVTAQPPLGSIDLNGVLIVALNQDATVGVIDPKLNLQTSNMIAAATLIEQPSAMAIDPVSFYAHFVTKGLSGLAGVSLLTGRRKDLLQTEPPLSDVASASRGGIWVGRTDGHVLPLDAPDLARRVGGGAVSLRKASEPDNSLLAAFASKGGLSVFDGATGTPILNLPGLEALHDLALLGDGTVVALPITGWTARVIYADAPGNPVEISLGFPAERLVTSSDGRYAIAYTPGAPAAVVIDLARAEVVQPLQLNEGTLSEVTFTDEAAYLLSLDGGFAGLIDLDSIALGRAARVRKIDLAVKSDQPTESEGLLVPLWPSPQVIAVSPETQTGWLLHDDQAVGEMPPMDSLRLRGGVPRQVAVLDRSLQETRPGVFETVALVPGGEHEVVLTTGIGGMTACIRFRVRGVTESQRIELLSLEVDAGNRRIRAGEDVELSMTFRNGAGESIAVRHAEFLVPSLSSSWVGRMTFRETPDGSLKGTVRFPHAGPFALQPLSLPKDLHLKSAVVLEVSS